MKKISIYGIFACIFALIFSCVEQRVATTPAKKGGISPIVLPVPERAPGQTDVINLVTPKLETVRVGFVGLGMRGPGAVERFTQIPGTEIVALCDIEKNRVEKGQEILDKAGKKRAVEYYGSAEAYKKMCERDDIDLIYIVTDWKHHVPIALYAMEHGKHVAIEVPAAMNMKDIWALIDTSERTRKHCMMLENCVYDFFELTTLNMAQQGVFGEVLHTEGSYIHNLKDFWKAYYKNWRLEYNKDFRGDVYPTHGIGPACQLLDIHRGDRMKYLVSMDTKPVNGPQAWKDMFGKEAKDFKNGDHTVTMIRTENGKTIQIQHNVVTPRPYSRMYQLTGTKGFANKYPVQGYALEEVSEDVNPDHEKLDAHGFVSEEMKKALMAKYKHPILVELEERAKKVGGHGGMDYIMDYRLVYCLQNGLPLDMDVYDLAEWSCLTELSAISIENGSAPVAIPDFTRGAWKKVKGYRHAFADDWAKK
uniref:Gfo/Idh/MocA family protein n=1 Tax=Ornithobacterium rhinotracheale TaxID=28251 RepID=UPI0039A402AA